MSGPGADRVREAIGDSPWAARLGVAVEAADEQGVELVLPFAEENSNGDRALHGGVAASLVAIAARGVARAALGEASGPWHAAAVQVAYLSAALGEAIRARARPLRRGRDLVVVEADVETGEGKPVARGLVSVRARAGAPPAERPPAAGAGDEAHEADPGPMGPFIHRIPFHGRLGIAAEHMTGGRARIAMPWSEALAGAGGGVHEGAVLALLDTTGAMAAWAETGPGRFRASTPAIQAQLLGAPPRADLVGRGRVLHRDGDHFLSRVEIAERPSGRLVAHGNVNYRIVTGDRGDATR